MAFDSLAQLLVLQDRDRRVSQVKAQLEQWPVERETTEREIAAEKERVSKAEVDLRNLEVRRKELEGEVALAEERVVRYRTQQLQVKKQDEYDALQSEITRLRDSIDDQETAILDLLDNLDRAKAALEETKWDVAARVSTLETHLKTIDEALSVNRAEVGEAETALRDARTAVSDEESLRQYDFVRRQVKRLPIVVPLVDGKCQGCHLKVPSDVGISTRRGDELVLCSSCGRILYAD